MTEEEHERLDGLMSPLFDIWLKFRDDFARVAIEKLDLTDEDAEACARLMEATGTDGGGAFAYLMRHIIDERIAREVGHMAASVMEYEGVRAVRYEGIRARYDRIPKGEA
jgi:hypothetical protein